MGTWQTRALFLEILDYMLAQLSINVQPHVLEDEEIHRRRGQISLCLTLKLIISNQEK